MAKDNLSFFCPKSLNAQLSLAAAVAGENRSEYIRRAILQRMQREGARPTIESVLEQIKVMQKKLDERAALLSYDHFTSKRMNDED